MVSLATVIFAAAAMEATAQVSIGVSPIRVEHAVQPGQLKTDIVTVSNLSTKPQRLQVTVADWYLSGDGIPVFVKRGKMPDFSMSEWTEVNPTELEIPAGGSHTLRYSITVPSDAPDGGYRTAILIESLPEFPGSRQAMTYNINARIGVVIYNRVGKSQILVDIASQQIIPFPDAPAHAAVQLEIKNSGRMHFRVVGECIIEDREGRVLQTLSIPDSVVLPQSLRSIVLPISTELPRDGYRILSRVDTGLPEILEIETLITALTAAYEKPF